MDIKEHTEFEKKLHAFLEKEGFDIVGINATHYGQLEYSIFIKKT